MTEQEARPERVTLMVTEHEKKAVRAVAAAMDTTESDLLRAKPIAEVVLEYERIRAALGKAA